MYVGMVIAPEEQAVIKKILVSMDVCEKPSRPPPRILSRD